MEGHITSERSEIEGRQKGGGEVVKVLYNLSKSEHLLPVFLFVFFLTKKC